MKKKLLSVLLCLCMVMTLLPTTALAAEETYDLWVGGVQVTSDNASNVLSDGGTVSYDEDTNTLTLKGANITGVASIKYGAGIYTGVDDLTIATAEGTTNTVTGAANNAGDSYGIYSYNAELTLSGSGTLNVTGGTAKDNSCGIYCYKATSAVNPLTVAGGTVTVTGGESTTAKSYGVRTQNEVVVTGGTATFQGGSAATMSYGVVCYRLDVTGGTAKFQGGTPATESYGAYVNGTSEALITGGTVTFEGAAAAKSYGLYLEDPYSSDDSQGLAAGSYKGATAAIICMNRTYGTSGTTSVASVLKPGFAYYKGTNVVSITDGTFSVGGSNETITVKGVPVTLTFNADGGTFSGNSSQSVCPGDTYGPLPAPTKTGYTFGGWYTEKNGDGTKVESGATVTAFVNHTLYAKWTINQYTISFNSNGGSAVAPITQDYNTAVTAPADPTRDGYTFAGWSPALPTTMPAESRTHTAQWTEKAAVSIETGAKSYTYDGTAKAFVVSGTPNDGYTVEYYVSGEWTAVAPTNIGTYNVRITRAEDQTHKKFEQVITGGLVIDKAPSSVTTAPEAAENLVYDGEEKNLLQSAGVAENGTMNYSLDQISWSTSIPTGTDAKTYTVYYKAAGNANYSDSAVGSISVTIAKATMSDITAEGYNGTYDGAAHGITVKNVPNGATVTYSTDGETYTFDNQITNATNGEQTVYYKVSKANYNDVTGTATVTIAKADSALTTVPTANGPFEYNGSERTLVATGEATGGTVQYKLNDGEYGTAVPKATNADTYTVYYKVVGDANHNDVAEASVTVTIAKKAITITGAAVSDKGYDGNDSADVTAVTFAGNVAALVKGTDYTVTGTFPDANADISDVDVTISVTLTGDALTNYSLADANYTTAAAAKINKANHPTYGTTESATTDAIMNVPGTKTYTLPCSELDGVAYTVTAKTTANIVADVAPTIVDNTLTYTSKECNAENATDTITVKISSTNYNDITLTLTVKATSKQIVTISGVEAASDLVYDGTAKSGYTGTLSCDQEWDMSELTTTYYLADGTKTTEANSGAAGDGLAPKNVGSYKVTFAVPESSETHTGNLTLAFAIDKADGSVTAPTPKTLTYTGEEQVLINAGSSATGEIQYKVGDGSYSTALPAATTAGTYMVSYKVVGDDNHNDVAEASISVTIAKATPTGTPAYTAITTTGKTLADAALNAGTITPAGGTITWDLGDSQSVAANTAYAWTYTPTDTTNYNNLTGTITPYVYVAPPASSSDGSSYTPSYPVGIQTDKDSSVQISSNAKNAEPGDQVKLTVTPDAFYKVDEVIVKDRSGKVIEVTENEDGTFSFKMPASKVTVEAVYSFDNPFVDVKEDAYYAPAVEWALVNSITGGTTAETFAPNAACTRGQMMTFLWRAAGCPEPVGTGAAFDDVSESAYYAKAIQWAVEQGITTGTTATTFAPNAACSRAHMATFLYRMANGEVMDLMSIFQDVSLEAYYAEAVQWALEKGVTNGTGDGTTYSPNDICTRGQMVTFLYRYFAE